MFEDAEIDLKSNQIIRCDSISPQTPFGVFEHAASFILAIFNESKEEYLIYLNEYKFKFKKLLREL